MTEIGASKAEARAAAFLRRKTARAQVDQALAQRHLLGWLSQFAGQTLAGYMPINSEIDPLPVMAQWAAQGPVCVPVIDGPGLPLRFRQWRPGCAMIEGPFRALVPEEGAFLDPEVLIVPLLAFDRGGRRLGYGGGYYDRTLQGLRAMRPTQAAGFAFAAQETPRLVTEATDQPLDVMITETGVILPHPPKPLAPAQRPA